MAAAPAQPQTGSFGLASASSRPVELRPARAAGLVNGGDSSANAVISERGFWQTSPDISAQMSAAAQSAAARVASADSTSSTPWPAPDRAPTGNTLAYAPASHPATPARPVAGSAPTTSTPSPTRTAQAAPTQRDTTVAVKRGAEPAATTPAPASTTAQTLAAALAQAKAGQQFNDPWMRAMIVAPSAGAFMSTSLLGTTDYPHAQPLSAEAVFIGDDDIRRMIRISACRHRAIRRNRGRVRLDRDVQPPHRRVALIGERRRQAHRFKQRHTQAGFFCVAAHCSEMS